MNPFLNNNTSQFIIRYRDDIDRSAKYNQSKPISVSSDVQIQMKNKKKTSIFQKINSVQKINRKKPNSVHTNLDDKKQQRQISRIPIQYLQQRDYGNPSDKVRGRVIYRGYAPKNTYFYFKTLKAKKDKQAEIRSVSSINKLENDYHGQDIIFNSKFESGNLHAAVRMNTREYWLYMRQDTNTHGLRQWFYFQMKVRRDCKVKLRIYKFSKRFSLYKCGMKPFVKKPTMDWKQDGLNILYEYDSEQKCFYLQFQYEFKANQETYFATLPPYTYSNLNDYIQTIQNQEKITINKIGNSLSGLDILSINISNKKMQRDRSRLQKITKRIDDTVGQAYKSLKEAIIVLCRTHPGQTVSNFALQNFIQRVLELGVLTEKYNFYIIPMVNPDGVFVGNHRTGILGQDLNRKFTAMDLEFYPEVEVVQNFVLNIQKQHKIAFLFDLHGHSAKKNIFAYGQESQIGTHRYLMSRIIPKILSESISSFKYDYCVFRAAKQKQNTARVYFSNKNGINAVTFEQSYGLLDIGNINICHWRNFGTALANSLVQFLNFQSTNLIPQITSYMSQQITVEKQIKKQKQQKKRQKERHQVELLKTSKKVTMKTEFNEQVVKNVVHDILHRKRVTQIELQNNMIDDKQQIDTISEADDQLSSGDQDKQLTNNEFQEIKKDIFRVGIVNRQFQRRQTLCMAEKKVELVNYCAQDFSTRLHHKNSSAIQRIYKFRSRQKDRQSGQFVQLAFSNRVRQKNIELPSIRK